jgi:hypothetical protein
MFCFVCDTTLIEIRNYEKSPNFTPFKRKKTLFDVNLPQPITMNQIAF